MSKTLFWYILKDLLKIFLMTSGVLAGIMAFGGLLKPLMQYGLTASQVGKMLAYFMPATQTYSFAIAALFATTVVYGRLGSDNEITACRASGISYLALTMPAVVLGLILSIISLVCLSFVVPHYMLKVERVAFDSLADVVQKSIHRSHQIKIDKNVIYAESAEILPPPKDAPDDEVVRLYGPMFCSYSGRDEKNRINIPGEFYTARSATVIIHRTEDDVQFIAKLDEGTMIPREFKGASIGGIGSAEFGPVPIPSLIRENTKFMDIKQLKRLYQDPTRSREIQALYAQVTRQEQEAEFVTMLAATLKRNRQFHFVSEDQTYTLLIDSDVTQLPRTNPSKLGLTCEEPGSRHIRLQRGRGGEVVATDDARQLVIRAFADTGSDLLKIRFELEDVMVGTTGRRSFTHSLSIPMPPQLREWKSRGPQYYLARGSVHSKELKEIRRKLPDLRSGIEAEIHARVSFAVSCLVLVLVGCALGMMFRTGNYLNAFALSVIPALVSLALIITGQHVCENDATAVRMGLAIIWSGNVAVLLLVAALMSHLRRQ